MKDLKQQRFVKSNLQSLIIDLLSGKALERKKVVELFPFLLYLVLLVMFYINNSYQTEKYVRQISAVERELKDLRSEYITTKSQLMYKSKQTEVETIVEAQGLSVSKNQPYIILTD
jgi:hypothetical protein